MITTNTIRLLLAVICSFLSVAGIAILWIFANRGLDYFYLGGGARFGALAMGCYALMGLIFTVVFGYLAYRILTPILCLLQALLCLLVATAGHVINQQHQPETHTLTPNTPLQWRTSSYIITESPAMGIEDSARLLTKDDKGEHESVILKDQRWEYRGCYAHYQDKKGDQFTLELHYQPGTLWIKVGNIGCMLSIVSCILMLIFRKKIR